MKQTRQLLLIVWVLVMFGIWGFVSANEGGDTPLSFEVLIFVGILIGGLAALFSSIRRQENIKAGFPAEDELSKLIKYKAGYYAFIGSIYLWLLIFMFKALFDVSGIRDSGIDAMIGGGILTMAALSVAVKHYLGRHYHEDQD